MLMLIYTALTRLFLMILSSLIEGLFCGGGELDKVLSTVWEILPPC